MTKIVADFAGNELTAVVQSRLSQIARYWGYNAFPSNFGGYRLFMNALMPPEGRIADRERASSFHFKINNYHNNPDAIMASIFDGGGVFYAANPEKMFTDTAGTVRSTDLGQAIAHIKPEFGASINCVQATGSQQPVRSRVPANGVKNLAVGSAAISNPLFWLASFERNGITGTRINQGTDIDGLPFVDIRFQGTSTSTFHSSMFVFSSPVATKIGETFIASFFAQRIGGVAVAGVTIAPGIIEADATNAFIVQLTSNAAVGTTEVLTSITRTMNQSNVVFMRGAISLAVPTATVIDQTYRIKGMQFERGSARTAFQFSKSLNDLTENGQVDVHGLTFNRVNNALPIGPFPSGINGQIVVIGENFSHFEPITIAPGGSVTIGGTRLNVGAADGVTASVGRILGFGVANRILTALERTQIKRFVLGDLKGKGWKTTGPELALNGDFSIATGWTLGATQSISGGALTIGDGATDELAYNSGSPVLNRFDAYEVTLSVTSDTSPGAQLVLCTPAGVILATAINGNKISGAGTKVIQILALASPTADWVPGLLRLGSDAGAMVIDTMSVKKITPEA